MPALDITGAHAQIVARHLHDSAGPGGADATTWQDWLLRYGAHSEHLRDAVAHLTRVISNTMVPWESIHALMASRLIALDKCPGVRPIGIRESLGRLMGKTVMLLRPEKMSRMCVAPISFAQEQSLASRLRFMQWTVFLMNIKDLAGACWCDECLQCSKSQDCAVARSSSVATGMPLSCQNLQSLGNSCCVWIGFDCGLQQKEQPKGTPSQWLFMLSRCCLWCFFSKTCRSGRRFDMLMTPTVAGSLFYSGTGLTHSWHTPALRLVTFQSPRKAVWW